MCPELVLSYCRTPCKRSQGPIGPESHELLAPFSAAVYGTMQVRASFASRSLKEKLPEGSKDPNIRALGPKCHSDYNIWALNLPSYLSPWTLRAIDDHGMVEGRLLIWGPF